MMTNLMISRCSARLLMVSAVVLFLSLNGSSWYAVAQDSGGKDLSTLQILQRTWTNSASGWSGTAYCIDWDGVTCVNGRVTELKLPSSNLTGGIPPDIGLLTSLEILELSYNPQLGGDLPPALGSLTSLKTLSIINSGLTGSIPAELSTCTNLSIIALNQNNLDGGIPDLIGTLQKLTWFDISENQISGGLPVARLNSDRLGLDNLTSCAHFHFYNNLIGGNIPQELFTLPNLVHMLLDGNGLQGSVPTNVSGATGLEILRLDNNKLSNPLPSQLNELSNLIELHLNNNSFSGSIPVLSALTNLLLLDVSDNPFSPQQIPSWIYSMTPLLTLNMDSVGLTGRVDPRIFDLPNIQTLSLSNNSLNGSLTFVGNSPSSLVNINLQNNSLSDIQGTPLVNGVASSAQVWLEGNPLCSTPTNSKYCQQSEDVANSWNASTPSNCHSCADGQAFNPLSSDCHCSFPLTCYMQLTSPSFQTINDSGIANIRHEYAQAFNLDDTQVFIPNASFSDSRMNFDLLFFPPTGPYLDPSKVQDIQVGLRATSHGLKEGPYVLLSVDRYTVPPKSNKKSHIGLIVGIVAAVVLLGIIIGLITLYALRQKRRADKAEVSRPFASWGGSTGDHGEAPQLKGARWFSLAELTKATHNFHEHNEIGAGGYGKVYRAELPTGEVVAVKRAGEGSMQGDIQFKNEIELLSRVHHKHLVGLVGFCYEQGEQMLVYEFMPNGTLRDHLLGHFDAPLTWVSRVTIALGSARGIAYLHEMANPPIIHRDIKSSNILLDERMIAKVADFGLSKLAPDMADKNHVSTQVKGTLGYLDPEYYMTNQLSEKSDVYSFGVVLLEMLSARQPIERGRYIVREVRTALNKGGIKALDPLLDPFLGNYPKKQLEAVLDLALHCVEESASQRPTMNEVVKELEVIAGHSQPNSGVHITIEPQNSDDDPYGRGLLKDNNDPSFQYSGAAFMPPTVEPK